MAAEEPVDLHINDPVHFIPSQHQGTCFTDSIETILCYADTVRHVFLGELSTWLTQDTLRRMTPTDPEFNRFVHSYVSSRMPSPSPSVVNYVKSMFLRYTLRQFQQQEERLLRDLGRSVNAPSYPTSSKTLRRRGSIGPSANRVHHYAREILYKKKPSESCSTESLVPQIELFRVTQSLLHPYVRVDDILGLGLSQVLNLFESNKLLAINILLVGPNNSGHAINVFRNNGVFYLGDNENGIAEPIRETAVLLILNALAIPNTSTCATAFVYTYRGRTLFYDIVQNGVYINLLRMETPFSATTPSFITTKVYPTQNMVFYEAPDERREPTPAELAAAELARLPPLFSVDKKAPARSKGRTRRRTRI
jgi:hypothetical protein